MRRQRRATLVHYSICRFDGTTPSHDERAVAARPNIDDGGARRRSVRRGTTPASDTVRSDPAVPVKSSEAFGRVLKLVRIDVTTTDGHPPKGRTSRERTVSTLVPGECYLPDGPTGTLRLPRYIGRRSTGETVDGGVHRREVGRNVVFIYQTVRADHHPPTADPESRFDRCVARSTTSLSKLCLLFSSRGYGQEPGTEAAVTPERSSVRGPVVCEMKNS